MQGSEKNLIRVNCWNCRQTLGMETKDDFMWPFATLSGYTFVVETYCLPFRWNFFQTSKNVMETPFTYTLFPYIWLDRDLSTLYEFIFFRILHQVKFTQFRFSHDLPGRWQSSNPIKDSLPDEQNETSIMGDFIYFLFLWEHFFLLICWVKVHPRVLCLVMMKFGVKIFSDVQINTFLTFQNIRHKNLPPLFIWN